MTDPFLRDESTARATAEQGGWAGDELLHLGLVGEGVPDRCPKHPDGCPPVKVLSSGAALRVYPGRLVTPAVVFAIEVWRLARSSGVPVLTLPLLAWPMPLLESGSLVPKE